MEVLLGLVCIALITAVVLLLSNRTELLTVVKDKENVIDANTRAITTLEGKWQLAVLVAQENEKRVKELQEMFEKEKDRNDKVISQKKSSETKIGQISEQLAPFLENFNHDPKETRFLGSPIDMIAFNFDEGSITFLEIKTGNAQESKRQKIIKNAIKLGKVYYEQLRINEKGIKVKQEQNSD